MTLRGTQPMRARPRLFHFPTYIRVGQNQGFCTLTRCSRRLCHPNRNCCAPKRNNLILFKQARSNQLWYYCYGHSYLVADRLTYLFCVGAVGYVFLPCPSKMAAQFEHLRKIYYSQQQCNNIFKFQKKYHNTVSFAILADTAKQFQQQTQQLDMYR